MSNSILETFYIMFSSDASKVKQGAQDAYKSTDELEGKIKSAAATSDVLGSSFMRLATQAAGALAAVFSVQRVITETFTAAHFADELGETAKGLGISTEQLSIWSDAVKFAGGSAESAQESFKTLSGSLAQIDATGHSRVKPFFDELGVSIETAHGKIRPINDILLDVAKKFETMGKQESFGFGRKLQLDEGMIRLLQRGRVGVEELLEAQKALGVVTDDNSETGRKWRETVDEMEHASRTFFLTIASSTFPVLEEGMQWVIDHGPLLKQAIEGVTGALVLLAGTKVVVFLAGIIEFFEEGIAAGATFFEVIETGLAVIAGGLSLPFVAIFALIAGAVTLIIHYWDTIKEHIDATIQSVKNAVDEAKNYLGLGDSTHEAILSGKVSLANADSSPTNARSSNVFSSSLNNAQKSNTINVGDVTINTQATDAEGVANGFATHFKREMFQVVTNSDDGVAM